MPEVRTQRVCLRLKTRGKEKNIVSTRDWQRDMETCQKASPGPWRPGDDGRIYCSKGYYVATIYKLLTPDGLADDVATTNANMQLIAEAREALPYWLERVRELEAQVAVMRDALLNINELGNCDKCGQTYVLYDTADAKHKALSTTAGRELLERVKKLEAVAEAAQEFLDTISLAERTGADVIMPPVQWQALYKLREALAALDCGRQNN
jgi:hypothetical protein